MLRRESEDRDGVAARVDAASEGTEGVPLRERQVVERAVGGRQRASIASRVRDEEDHAVLVTVTLLERQTPLERLQIVEHRLGLDRDPPAEPADQGVARSEIALDRERDLRRPAEARMEANPKPLEKPDLSGVAHRVAGRVGPEPNVHADNRTDGSKVRMAQAAGAPMLELPELDVVDARRRSDDTQAQPRPDATAAKVGSERPKIVGCPSPASIRRAFASGHRLMMFRISYFPLGRTRSVVWTTTSDGRQFGAADRTVQHSRGVVHQPTPDRRTCLNRPRADHRVSLVVPRTTTMPDATTR
jgi:hypothetical protein